MTSESSGTAAKMRTLFLLRHAKSCWKDTSLADFDRPLKRRGVQAAARIGKLIREQELPLDLVLCSTAIRARQTWERVARKSRLEPKLEFSDGLYHCSVAAFGEHLRKADSSAGAVMLVGHNPGMEEFLAQLVGHQEPFPTGALARLELELDDWSDFGETTPARLIHLWRPRELESTE